MEPNPAGDSAAQKTLTPAEVHNVAFKKPPIGKRGYDEEEVDYFLDVVEAELARLIEANEVLKNGSGNQGVDLSKVDQVSDQHLIEENQRLAGLLAGYEQQHSQLQDGQDGLRGSLQAAEQRAEELARQLDEAQRQAHGFQRAADEARAQAEEAQRQTQEALARPADGSTPRVAADPNQQAVKVLMLAQQTADQHVSGAQTEADRLLTEARTNAEQLNQQSTSEAERRVNEAQSNAEALRRESEAQAAKRVNDAESHAASVAEALETRKSALERRLEELSTFEREYRSRLKSYLESQLRDLQHGADGDAPQQ